MFRQPFSSKWPRRNIAAVDVIRLNDDGILARLLHQIFRRAADINLGQRPDFSAMVDARAVEEDHAADLMLAQELDVGFLARGVAPRARR